MGSRKSTDGAWLHDGDVSFTFRYRRRLSAAARSPAGRVAYAEPVAAVARCRPQAAPAAVAPGAVGRWRSSTAPAHASPRPRGERPPEVSLVSTDTSVPLPRMSGLGPSESALLETILKEAPVGFAFFDTSARFQRVNPTLARLYGRAEEECIGRLPHDVLGEAAAEAHVAAVDRVLAGEPVVYGDQFPPFGPAGAQAARWAPSWFPTHGEGGDVDGVALIAVDLSDRLRAEGELRRS